MQEKKQYLYPKLFIVHKVNPTHFKFQQHVSKKVSQPRWLDVIKAVGFTSKCVYLLEVYLNKNWASTIPSLISEYLMEVSVV